MRPSPVVTVAGMVLVAAVLGASPRASAEESVLDEPIEKEGWPTEIVRRPLTLAEDMLEIVAPANVNVSTGRVADPVYLSPSVYYGVSDGLTVGVRHLLGLCVTDKGGCPKVYNDVGLDTLWRLRHLAGADLALGVALDAAPIADPFTLAGEVRLVARWAGGPFAFAIAPTLNFGLTQRDSDRVRKRVAVAFPLATYPFGWVQDTPGNKEFVSVPASLQIQVLPPIAVVFGMALSGPLDPPAGDFGDLYTIPVGVAAIASPTHMIDLGASLTFGNLLGRRIPNTDRADPRGMQVFAAIRL